MFTRLFTLTLFITLSHNCIASNDRGQQNKDTSKVISLNKESYNLKFSDSKKAISLAKKALEIANTISYEKGKANSYRMIGIAYDYANKKDLALNAHFKALTIFKKINDIEGEAKVLNNIGNVYNQYDNKKALEYYHKTLKIADKYKIEDLIASCYLNIGTIYFRNSDYKTSLAYSLKSRIKFLELNKLMGIIQATQSIGVNYFYLKEYYKAEEHLLNARKQAKKENLVFLVSSIDQTLASIYTEKKNFNKAEFYINEGMDLAIHLKDSVLISDFSFKLYELEKGRGNYKKSLDYLVLTIQKDSINYKKNITTILQLNEEYHKQEQKQKEYELKLAKQKNILTLFVASIIVFALSLILILILIRSKKKTEKTNKELLLLNQEISQQKENLDKINSRLEEIIADRTKDLISKNRKLSEYSSHLSHQVRGPVATLKGLIMLSQDNLIEEKECISQMKKCIDDIDEQIMDINIALHDPDRKGLSKNNS